MAEVACKFRVGLYGWIASEYKSAIIALAILFGILLAACIAVAAVVLYRRFKHSQYRTFLPYLIFVSCTHSICTCRVI